MNSQRAVSGDIPALLPARMKISQSLDFLQFEGSRRSFGRVGSPRRPSPSLYGSPRIYTWTDGKIKPVCREVRHDSESESRELISRKIRSIVRSRRIAPRTCCYPRVKSIAEGSRIGSNAFVNSVAPFLVARQFPLRKSSRVTVINSFVSLYRISVPHLCVHDISFFLYHIWLCLATKKIL